MSDEYLIATLSITLSLVCVLLGLVVRQMERDMDKLNERLKQFELFKHNPNEPDNNER